MTSPIPRPPGLPLVGNAFDIDSQDQIESLIRLADIYGPIYELRLSTGSELVVSTHELFDEICDEKRFGKAIVGGLAELRNVTHDGLFTARSDERNWGIAHRVLVPAFGPLAIRDMFDEMHEILTQLVLKWARYGPTHRIDVADDFTRLTLDSIALCAMDTQFNSFYKQDMHPFINAMQSTLLEAGRRSIRPTLINKIMRSSEKKYFDDIETMRSTVREIIADKRANPSEKNNLVNAMLNRRDPKTGEKMSDDSIIDNMVTFLVAGHETTSGLLSFLFYNFMENREVLRTAQQEVDNVIGTGPINVDHMSKLPYITACLRETLRLTPTVTGSEIAPLPDTTENPILIGGGKYMVKPDQSIFYILKKIQTDPAVYGDDAKSFRPERMLDENFNKLPKNSWKPFGNGKRSCIGRNFAWEEAKLATAMSLQVFDFRLDDAGYELSIKETLTIKPKNLFLHARLREGIDSVYLEKMLSGDHAMSARNFRTGKASKVDEKPQRPISIFYGSNMGTCESLAQTIARSSATHGYDAVVKPLDDATKKVPQHQPVLIITSSYEGEPPDNAERFVTWLEHLGGDAPLDGVQYAVFGCGNRDWKDTFQLIPTLVDTMMKGKGAKKLLQRGSADAANNDIFNDFEQWEDDKFWPAIESVFGADEGSDDAGELQIELSRTLRASHLNQDVTEAVVLKNELLTEGKAPKRHLELKLPEDMKYRAGDYLAVLPTNHVDVVGRALLRFGLPWDAFITVQSGKTSLPSGSPMSIFDILSSYVELSQTATRRNIETIMRSVSDDATKARFLRLAGDQYHSQIREKRVSPLDLLEKYPQVDFQFGEFLAMLPQLRLRQYSISSSPLANPGICTLTWGVLDKESFQGGKRFRGVASNYLSELQEGDHIHVNVKHSHESFHLPSDAAHTPIIMICAGTGIAPFRGFVQERAKMIEDGSIPAPALLYIGCQRPGEDELYRADLAKWSLQGAVDVRYAYSRDPKSSSGAKYVQDRFWQDEKDVREYFWKGAKVYICGQGRVAEGVRQASVKMYMLGMEEEGTPKTEEEAEEWFASLRNERFMSDVFD